jgi:hypothetical protein
MALHNEAVITRVCRYNVLCIDQRGLQSEEHQIQSRPPVTSNQSFVMEREVEGTNGSQFHT